MLATIGSSGFVPRAGQRPRTFVATLIVGALAFSPLLAAVLAGTFSPALLLVIPLAAYLMTVVAVFHNVALAACATRSLDGHDTTLGEGYRAALSCIVSVLSWSLVALTVGILLSLLDILADILPGPLRVIANVGVWLLGFAWAVATFFVVPVIVLEGAGSRGALDRSKRIVRERWGESASGVAAVSVVPMLMTLLGFAAGSYGVAQIVQGNHADTAAAALAAPLVGVGVVLALAGMIIGGSLRQVFKVCLYRYAVGDGVAPGFASADLAAAIGSKK